MLSRKAQTIAGLAVQTRAITMAAGDLWNADLEPNEAYERTFIEAVCAFVGVEIPSRTGSVS
jgi:hypothetical protein